MTDEQYKKAEQIKKEVSRNKIVAEMLKRKEITSYTGLTNLRITLKHIPGIYEAMVSAIEHENEKLLKQFEEL